MADPRAGAWHWPVFDGVLCGTMDDRTRLGLPDRYVPDRASDGLSGAYERLRGRGRAALAALCGDASAPLIDRLAAGGLLALLGDPRLSTLDPPMVDIPGGRVEIGLEEAALDGVLAGLAGLGLDRAWLAKECPRHQRELAPYRIGRFPVTNQEYRDFLLASGHSEIPSSWSFRRYPQERSNHPVYSVSPEAADAYAAWLSRTTGRRFRLPGEAEWEHAAAGPEGREYPWGEGFDPERANTAETGLFRSSPVGVFPGGASPFGALDMAGNVEEYVADPYRPYPGGAFVADHLVEMHGSYRIARGGGFARFRDLARTRRRHGCNPRSETYAMGFRLVEEIA
jgi:formylglycine-generating enzyme required for sulfatase activity